MTPTQAQIEAAHAAYYKARHDDKPLDECWKAAPTAAAQVGEPDIEGINRDITKPALRWAQNATIERCAQVVKEEGERWGIPVHRIISAVRKLKDEP